ncbi:MAG: flagellar basal body-associated FliL family protein [Gemmatimonadaceae bacterium]
MAEETAQPTEAAPPEKKGGIAAMLPLVGGITAGLALGAVLGLVVLGPRLSASPAPASAITEAHDAKKDAGKKGEAASMYQMDNLVLNPAGSGGTRFLLLSVALEVKDAATLDVLKARDAEIRDAILRMFGSKTVEQVSEASTRDQLRIELLATIDKMFAPGTVRKLYFPQFVIQ